MAQGWPAILAVLALLATGMSGESHIFLRLRILHPFIAMLGGGLILLLAYRMVVRNPMRRTARRRGQWLGRLVLAQWFPGLVNLVLLAPIWLQIVPSSWPT